MVNLVPVVCIRLLSLVMTISCFDPNHLPYLPSPIIADVTFDWSSHDRRAQGSDNWPITWADDDHQYSSWGDGGGFCGTNSDGRVSLGVARIEGSATHYQGFDVWGGNKAENQANFDGKSYGIISVDGLLYMWVSPGSDTTSYEQATIFKSINHGASWTPANWDFTKRDGIIFPTFLQFGKDYRGARDDFVYIYANHFKPNIFPIMDELRVQKPGEIALMRTHKTKIVDRTAYEFFGGLEHGGKPVWSKDLKNRRPVFKDPNGVGWNTSVSYNPGIGRYLLITEHTTSFRGNIGMFDAPEPWGPWTTVKYASAFGAPNIEPSTFFWNFSNKWLSDDGKSFVMIFTGVASNDSWNTVRGSFLLRKLS